MAGTPLNRRSVLALGGAALVGTAWSRLELGAHRTVPAQSATGTDAITAGLDRAFAGTSRHFWDAEAGRTRPTNGGGTRNGLVDETVGSGALWQRHAFTNTLFNQWRYFGDQTARAKLVQDWEDAAAGGKAGTWTTGVLAGRDNQGVTAYTFDDFCWQALYLMQAHLASPADDRPLRYMVDSIVNAMLRFTDPDTASNPTLTFASRSPNLVNLDYGLGTDRDAAGRTQFIGPPVQASRYGSLYTLPANSNFAGTYGQSSSPFEAHLAIAALYGHRALHYPWLRDYAVHAQQLIRTHMLTPDPAAMPDDPAHTPAEPAKRKAQYLVECGFRITTKIPSNDPYMRPLRPDKQWYGKPVRNLDSTYLGGAFAFCVLSAQLFRLTGQDEYRLDAINTANAIISPQAYGRLVTGRTLIQNTRDPHSDGHLAAMFVDEVLTLPGTPAAVRQAMIDTGAHIAATCITNDGFMTADWAGPELNPTNGTMTWDQEYTARPGGFAGHQQIMVTSESLAMLQAGALQARS